MTNEQILELAKTCECEAFAIIQERNDERDGVCYQFWEEQLIEFAQTIHKQTLKDMISVLQNVPNPEANRTAINKILNHIEMEAL